MSQNETTECDVCGEPMEADDVFMRTLWGAAFCSLPCRNEYWSGVRSGDNQDEQ